MEVPATAALDFPTVLALAGFVARSLAPSSQQSSAGQLATAVSLDAAWSDSSGEPCFARCSLLRGALFAYPLLAAGTPARLTPCCVAFCCAEPGDAVTQVVGVSCAYPGPAAADGLAGFWGAAVAATDLPSVIPHDRWAIEQHYSPDVAGAEFKSLSQVLNASA